MRSALLLLAVALASVAACAQSGQGGGPSGATSGTSGSPTAAPTTSSTPAPTAVPTLACKTPNPGSPLLRLLNREELDRTLSDIFPQAQGKWTNSLSSNNVSAYGFDNDHAASVGNQLASDLLDTSLSLATAVTASATLPNVLPCAATVADHACAEQFFMQYGKRLFRRPVATAEHDRYLSFFDASKAKSDFPTALKWMIVGLIQSPNAVYRREIGAVRSGGTRGLSPYEIATELAYTYTGSTPTADLLAKADSGNLGDLVAIAKTLQATPAKQSAQPMATLGEQALQHFFEGYLAYTRVTSIQKPNIPSFAGISGDMAKETEYFIHDVVVQKRGGLSDLLTAPTTYVSQSLAQYYGFPAPQSDFAALARPSGRGLGVLAQGSFLASDANADASSPTRRGLFAFTHLLCGVKPSPPATVPPIPTPQLGKITTRQRYEQQHAVPGSSCASCHKSFDPIGFGFEHYDEGGRYRQTEGTLTIDSSGSVANSADGTALITFQDEEGLVTGLAKQPVAYQCFAQYLATYAFGNGDESCLGASNVAALQSGAIGIADAFAALAAEPHLTQRSGQ